MNISLILTNKSFKKRAYFPEGLLSREGLLFSIYGIPFINDIILFLGDDSLYFQSRQLEADDEYAEREVEKYSI